jgi:hypothetical protein
MKYTGWCQNDFNAQGYTHRGQPRAALERVVGLTRHRDRRELLPVNENCTGLAQIARLGPTLCLKIPIRALKLAHN